MWRVLWLGDATLDLYMLPYKLLSQPSIYSREIKYTRLYGAKGMLSSIGSSGKRKVHKYVCKGYTGTMCQPSLKSDQLP